MCGITQSDLSKCHQQLFDFFINDISEYVVDDDGSDEWALGFGEMYSDSDTDSDNESDSDSESEMYRTALIMLFNPMMDQKNLYIYMISFFFSIEI